MPRAVSEVFPHPTPGAIAAAVDAWCRRAARACIAVAEALLDAGAPADAHDPAVRRALVASLARLVALCRPMSTLAGLRENVMATRPGDLWPTPHDGRFDFPATTVGAEWLDEIAARARRVRDTAAGDVVVGHTDWRVENMRLASDGSVSAVYDWDSIAVQREPVLVGGAAHLFTSDFRVPDRAQLPTRDEALAFIADCEAARGTPFGGGEHAAARAALVYAMAYTARCEHSDLLTDMGRAPARPERAAEPVPPGSARAFVAAHAEALLRRPAPSVGG